MQALGPLSGLSQTLQLLQPVWSTVQPVRISQPSKLSINHIDPLVPTRNYAAEVLRAAPPSLKNSSILALPYTHPPTAQTVLLRGARRPATTTHPSSHGRRHIWTSIQKKIRSFKPERVTSSLVYSQIVRLETEANAFPNNVAKQVTLWRAIMELDTQSAYEKIISRWERLLEFAPNSQIIKSDAAFRLYLMALLKKGDAQSVWLAAARRDQVLQRVGAAPTEPATVEDELNAENDASKSTQSPSHDIAEAVLSDPSITHTPVWAIGASGLGKSPGTGGFGGVQAGSKQQPLHVLVDQPKGSVAWQIGKTLLIVGLYGFITLTILGLVLENSGVLKTSSQVTEFEQSGGEPVKFSDVHGVEEAKEELQDIVEFLKNPASFSTLGGKLPKGVLLEGPPGTGKTLLARAVAGEAGVPFFFASGSDFDEIFVGVGAKRIRELFAAARKKQPAIIFLDELDAVGGKRSPKDQQFMKQTLNQLLVELDGFKQSEGIIVIGATNFPQSLDKALVRPGRFDRKVVVPLPDVKGRVQILKHHMKNVVNDPKVDVELLARVTVGFSGADLQNMINQAAVQASKEHADAVGIRHYEWARDKIGMGPERRSAVMEEKVKLAVAYHEGGHALSALFTKGAMPLYKVTCMPRGQALGVTHQAPVNDRTSVTFTEYIADMDVCTGGRAAEEFIYGKENITSGASSDLVRATDIARSMVRHWGFSDKVGRVVYRDDDAAMLSPQKKDEIESEVKRLVEESCTRSMNLIKSKETELHRLAKALVEHETLDAEEVKKVIAGEKIKVGEKPAEA